MKVFYRVKRIGDKQIVPYNYNIANGLDGAIQLGLETVPYFVVSEIITQYELGDIVLDGIQQIQYCLNKFNISVPCIDYPDVLHKYLGRKIWKDTINHIANQENLWNKGYFVKPIKEKAFTGKIISSIKDLVGCGSCYENYDVYVSEPLDIVYECRGFVYYDILKDLRPYSGDCRYMSCMNLDIINQAMKDWKKWEERPNSCSLDWGIVKENDNYKTVLIECNLPYALGCYGYFSIDYIKLISAYISQISNVEDELHFQ